MAQRIFSVKVDAQFLDELEEAASAAGLSRHGFVREVLAAAIEDRPIRRNAERRVAAQIREGLARDRAGTLALSELTRETLEGQRRPRRERRG